MKAALTGRLHRAAGPEILEERCALGGYEIGDAKATGAYYDSGISWFDLDELVTVFSG